MKAVVLLSGGLDSTTVLAQAVADGYECHALTIAYGQRHAIEISAARKIAGLMGVSHRVANVAMEWGGSALTDHEIAVPTTPSDGIPITYVPGRNTIFCALAMSYAEAIGARHIFLGISQIDYSGYPDCRQAFVDNFELLADVATKAGVEGVHWKIHAPLLRLSKADTIRLGRQLGVNYDLTHSCYQPIDGVACRVCDSCRIRDAAFAEVNA